MKHSHTLDQLEGDVLARIALHRRSLTGPKVLPVALVICAAALIGGLLTGRAQSRHVPPKGSEAALLAEDVSLAPSSLLASNR
jgi:hypothetical protein